MSGYNLYWGDSHTNLHGRHSEDLQDYFKYASEVLDFWPVAYYPVERYDFQGFKAEDFLPQEKVASDWEKICEFSKKFNDPGSFVVFPGYEWHGSGDSGDHNVFFLKDNPPMIKVGMLAELYERLRSEGIDAYAIPHHTAYIPGVRSKDWSVHDEKISPFAEIFSSHGSSESDEQCPGLWHNRNMGPGTAGGTIEDGLNAGNKFGIIASNDTHDGYGGQWDKGIMACWAQKLTRESLWEAFAARRVYGVTGDRMRLDFNVEGSPMGSAIARSGPVNIDASVYGCDAIDRIELLRNNRVIATHCHQGTWDIPTADEIVTFKFRIECGWGARHFEIPNFGPRQWKCSIDVENGEILSVEKCWHGSGQSLGPIEGGKCEFGFLTEEQPQHGRANMEANIFEIKARPSDTIKLDLDGKLVELTVAEAMAGSRIIDHIKEAGDYVRERFGIEPTDLPRVDRLYYAGHKVKIHKAIPEAGLRAKLDFVDENAPVGTNFYRVRVSQRNGQMAWSSPIWVTN